MNQRRLLFNRSNAMRQAVALFLATCLVLPSPALALRQAGLEENSAKQEFLNRIGADAGAKTQGSLPSSSKTGPSATGMEEVDEEKARRIVQTLMEGPQEAKTTVAGEMKGWLIRPLEDALSELPLDTFNRIYSLEQRGENLLVTFGELRRLVDKQSSHIVQFMENFERAKLLLDTADTLRFPIATHSLAAPIWGRWLELHEIYRHEVIHSFDEKDVRGGQIARVLRDMRNGAWQSHEPYREELVSAIRNIEDTISWLQAHWTEFSAAYKKLHGHLLRSHMSAESEPFTGNTAGNLRLSNKTFRVLRGHRGFIYSLAFAPNGEELVSAGQDGSARSWQVASGYNTRLLEHNPSGTGSVEDVVISPDGRLVASANSEGNVRLFNIATGNPLHTFAGHTRGVSGSPTSGSLVFSPNGKLLAFGAVGPEIRVWDVETGELRHSFSGLDRHVTSLAFSPDGKILASSTSLLGGGFVQLWDVGQGKAMASLTPWQSPHFKAHTNVLAFDPQGILLASGGWSGVQLWSVPDGHFLGSLSLEGDQWAPVDSLTFSPDGKVLAIGSSGRMRGGIHLWDVISDKPLQFVKHPTRRKHGVAVVALTFSPDGKFLASASSDRTVRLWEVKTAAGTEEGYYADLLTQARGIKSVSVEGGRRFYRTQDDLISFVTRGPELWVGFGKYASYFIRVQEGVELGSRTFRIWGREYSELTEGSPVEWADTQAQAPLVLGIDYDVSNPDKPVLTLTIDPRAKGISEVQMETEVGDFPHEKWIVDGAGTPIPRREEFALHPTHRYTKTLILRLMKPMAGTSVDISPAAGMEAFPIVTRRELFRAAASAAVWAAVPSLVSGRSEAKPVANPPVARRFQGEVVVEDLVVGETTSPQSLRLEIAAHETLLGSVQDNFRWIPIRFVSTNPEQAKEDLKDFTAQDQVYRMAVLDRMLLEPDQVARILPDQHAPAFLIYGAEANLLTPAVATAILKLQLPANGLFLLRLRQDDLGQTRLTIYA